jgi:hypothetical protein
MILYSKKYQLGDTLTLKKFPASSIGVGIPSMTDNEMTTKALGVNNLGAAAPASGIGVGLPSATLNGGNLALFKAETQRRLDQIRRQQEIISEENRSLQGENQLQTPSQFRNNNYIKR